jgi:hypothetical protein
MERDELVAALSEAARQLRARGEDHWANWLDTSRAHLERDDAYGLVHLMRAYGGMGSINDIYPQDEAGLSSLLGTIYAAASALHTDWSRRQT